MTNVITGRFIKNGQVKEYGSNGFRKKDIVVETTNEQYPQKILIELHQDNVNLTKGLVQNEVINVTYNLRGREWTDPSTGEVKYFNSVVGLKIERVPMTAPAPAQAQAPQDTTTTEPIGNEPNDLPF